MVTLYAIRRPSGDSSTLPTERSRDKSALARPWPTTEAADIIRATVQQRYCPARSKTDCKHGRMGLSLHYSRRKICPAILGCGPFRGQLVLLGKQMSSAGREPRNASPQATFAGLVRYKISFLLTFDRKERIFLLFI